MADELPPLEQMPDSSAVPLEQLQHAANWADTFGGSDTNLAQRFRHNQDIHNYATGLADQQAQQQQQLLQTNKVAQDFFIRTKQLANQHDLAISNLALREKHAANEDALLPLTIAAKHAQADAAHALEMARIKEDAMKSAVTADEAGFRGDRAQFFLDNPAATQEQIDANDISLNGRYLHAAKNPAVKEIVTVANRNSLARQEEARKAANLESANAKAAADAGALHLSPHQITASGAHTFTAEIPKPISPEQAGFIGRYEAPVAEVAKSQPILDKAGLTLDSKWDGKDSEFQKAIDAGKITPGEAGAAAKAIDAYKSAIGKKQVSYQSHFNEVSAKLGALQKSASKDTEIIERDGKKYEVNHKTKSVTPL